MCAQAMPSISGEWKPRSSVVSCDWGAGMKLPGRAWLEFGVELHAPHGAQLTQTAFFAPRGLAGWLYWCALYPIHALIFRGLIERVGKRAERAARSADRQLAGRPDTVGQSTQCDDLNR
ncbi:DUF2867 domain-containing protein [Limisphaera sp. 4302-co]|uniref:DUF2867 domain-containing protein n=1 Tax=Limisphaera sp. 4302-co TaxID=3400417 RepID=UPI003C234992